MIDDILLNKDLSRDEFDNLTDEERFIVYDYIYNISKCPNYEIPNNEITLFLDDISQKTLNDFDRFKKYPVYYQFLIFMKRKSHISKHDMKNFISSYELNDYFTVKIKEYFLFTHCNIIDNPTNQDLILLNNVIKKLFSLKNALIFIDERTVDPMIKLFEFFNIPRQILNISIKFWYIKNCKKNHINVMPELNDLYTEISDPQFENYYDLKKYIELYHDSQHYNISKRTFFRERTFQNTKYFFDKRKSYSLLADLLVLMSINIDPTINELISDNVVILEQLENSSLCNNYLPTIKSLINNKTLINDHSRTILEGVFSNCLHDNQQNSTNNALIKCATKVC